MLFALLGSQLVPPATAAAVGGLSLIAGMSWAVWVGSRGRRRVLSRGSGDPTVDGNRAAAARSAGAVTRHALAVRRIGISIAVLAVAVSVGTLTATAVTPQRTALRDLVELPLDPTAFVSPLSTFRSYTKDQADVPQLTVSGLPAGARLRLAALDAYDGRHFVVSDAEGPFVRIGRERPQASADQPVTVTVHIQNLAGSFLPLPGPIAELDFGGPRAAQLTQDLRYSESAATGLLPGGWQPEDTYSVLATVPAQPSPEQLAAARPTPATVPTTVALPDVVRSAANRYVGGVAGAGRQVEAIRAGLAADGVFSDGGPGEARSSAGHGLDRMAAMITGSSMVGDQEQYAALMALLVRSIGLPARVVVGFVPPPLQTSPASAGSADSASSDDVEVRGRDISAWVEVPFDGYGWVAFDPSPKPGKSSPDTQPPSSTGRGAVTVVVPPALPQPQPDTVNGENANQRPDVADPETPTAAADSGWLGLVLTILGWTAAVLALLALPVVIILGLKGARRRRRRRAERPEDRITGGWEQLLDTAVGTGYRPRPWHTRTEMAADLRSAGVLQVDWLAPAAD
ncbi:MAG TPA: transglutaminase-like domain-containing protein, partial [Nakamurella sp.]